MERSTSGIKIPPAIQISPLSSTGGGHAARKASISMPSAEKRKQSMSISMSGMSSSPLPGTGIGGRKSSISIVGHIHGNGSGRNTPPTGRHTPPTISDSGRKESMRDIKTREGNNSPDLAPGNDLAMDHIREKKRIANRRRTAVSRSDVARANLNNEAGGLAAMSLGNSRVKAPSLQYVRQWTGMSSSKRDALHRQDVEFKATFEKPLEQFIYPSLQLVEDADKAHATEREQHQRLHGHTDNPFVTRFDAHFPMEHKYIPNEHAPRDAYGSMEEKPPVQEGTKAKLIDVDERAMKSVIKQSSWSVGFNPVPDPPDKAQRDKFAADMKKGENYVRELLRKKYELVKIKNAEDEKNRRLQAMVTAPIKNSEGTYNRSKNQFAHSHYKTAQHAPVVVSFGSVDTPDSLYQSLSTPLDPVATALKEAERSKKEHSDETLFARVKTKLDLSISNNSDFDDNNDAIKNGLLYFQCRKAVRDDETEDDAVTAKRHAENTRRMMAANTNNLAARRAQTAGPGSSGKGRDRTSFSPGRGGGPFGIVTGFNPDADVTDGMDDLLAPSEQQQQVKFYDKQATAAVSTTSGSSIFKHQSIHHDGMRFDDYDSDASVPAFDSDEDKDLQIERNAARRVAMRDAARIRRAMGSKYVGYDYPEIMGRNDLSAFTASEMRSGGGAEYGSISGGGGGGVGGYGGSWPSPAARPHTSGGMSSRPLQISAGGLKSRHRMNNASMGGSLTADDATFDQSHTFAGSTFTGSLTSATVVVDIDVENASPKAKRRYAQDVLLLSQLKAGILPEQLIMGTGNRNADNLSIDVSHYGLGDEHGKCLGLCLGKLDTLTKLILKDNRLTSLSVPILLANVATNLVVLDLSHNDLHGQAVIAISNYFEHGTALNILNMSECRLTDEDITPICSTLSFVRNQLKEWNISHNRLTYRGMSHVVDFLLSKTAHSGLNCHLKSLDISWNEIHLQGATLLANAIGQLGSSFGMEKLNVSSNAITDEGGQRIGAAVLKNDKLHEVMLCQNGLMGRTCFVWARTLRSHPVLKKLDLSENPLSDEGACALFRLILNGLPCFVMMRDCTLAVDKSLFNNTFPANASPYTLDLSQPYDAAVLSELVTIAVGDPCCTFSSCSYKSGNQTTLLRLSESKQVLVEANSGNPWEIQESGIMHIDYKQTITVPTPDKVISAHGLTVLKTIVTFARNVQDRRKYLQMMCSDIVCTTVQVQSMIDEFAAKKIIGAGGLDKVDIVANTWCKMLDTENKYDFLVRNLNKDDRTNLISVLTFEQLRFNWDNCTGHWRIDLNNKAQRSVMMQIIALNNVESDFSKNHSRRADTSQKGNWFNFRNEKYCNEPFTIDKEFVECLPQSGTLDFDYVSTTRPCIPVPSLLSSIGAAASVVDEIIDDGGTSTPPNESTCTSSTGTGTSTSGNGASIPGPPPASSSVGAGVTSGMRRRTSSGGYSPVLTVKKRIHANKTQESKVITKDELDSLITRLGLSSRKKLAKPLTLITLLELQIAAAKYYFTTGQVLTVMYTFDEDSLIQAKVVVCLFSRIWDLWDFDVISRQLSDASMLEVVTKIGWLNLMNPLKPSHNYVLAMQNMDNRQHVVNLIRMCTAELGDQLKENPNSDCTVVYLFSKVASLIMDSKMSEIVRIAYVDFGENVAPVLWKDRRDMMKGYLVGTYPIPQAAFDAVVMYKEMQAAGTLTMGPIDTQYQAHLKIPKNRRKVKNAFKHQDSGGD